MATQTKVFFVKSNNQAIPNSQAIDLDNFIKDQVDDPGDVYIKIKLTDSVPLQALVNPDGTIRSKQLLESMMPLMVPKNMTVGDAQRDYVHSMNWKSSETVE